VADPGLTDRGRTQARLTGERLCALGVCRIISSPLRRTYETDRLAAEVLGLDGCAVETDLHLRSFDPHLIPHGVPGCALTCLSRVGADYHLLELASLAHLPVPVRTDWHSDERSESAC